MNSTHRCDGICRIPRPAGKLATALMALAALIALPVGRIHAQTAPIFVTVFPKAPVLTAGRAQQFRAHVFMTTNPAVTWSVNGTVGGNTTFGAIDFTGLYTAPAIVPANPNIIIQATSQADSTKSASVAARIAARVILTPFSDTAHIGETVQFSASVTGVPNVSVRWAVNGIAGGSAVLGTISSIGLYQAPATVPNPGMVSITATSIADPSVPGVANLVIYPAKMFSIFPSVAAVLPGAKLNFQYDTNVYYSPTKSSYGPIANWLVNGIPGGNALVGTITNFGQYAAPALALPIPLTVTVTATSAVDPSHSASATVTVAPPATQTASVTLLDTLTKIRPYDIVTGGSSLQLAAAQQEYADFQVLITGVKEDLSGIDVQVSDFVGSAGGVIPGSEATIYLEKYINASHPSRYQGSDTGEWPDPLVPRVDSFVHETRNAFPFNVNRISAAYRIYPALTNGSTTNAGLGAGKAVSSGTYTGAIFKRYDMVVDGAGAAGTATFKLSTDGGATFVRTLVPTSSNPVALLDGVSVSFHAGNIAGVADFNVGDTFWIFAAPLRNQPVWVDLYVPAGTPAGNYTGTVTVTQAGKPAKSLPIGLQVYNFAIPVTSSVPTYWGASWQANVQAHFLVQFGWQTLELGQMYGTACLLNRISCDTGASPSITFAADGTVAHSSYTSYDQTLGPLADGTGTPHGERQTTIKQRLFGANDTQSYFATLDQLAHTTAKGWRSRVFDYSRDEPHTGADYLAAMDRASLVRSADSSLRTLVTTDIGSWGGNLAGFVNRFMPNWMGLGMKIYQRGPNQSTRAFYDSAIQGGTELWWYDSCTTHGCGVPGRVPFLDNYPNSMMDTSAVMNRIWGFVGLVPYRVSGVSYYDSNYAYGQYFAMPAPRVDVWESIYYFYGNGDGTVFYPGRPSLIGGTTDIPIESIRLKHIRDAMVDMEYGLRLNAQGDSNFLASNILRVASDIYTYNPDPAAWIALRKQLGQRIR